MIMYCLVLGVQLDFHTSKILMSIFSTRPLEHCFPPSSDRKNGYNFKRIIIRIGLINYDTINTVNQWSCSCAYKNSINRFLGSFKYSISCSSIRFFKRFIVEYDQNLLMHWQPYFSYQINIISDVTFQALITFANLIKSFSVTPHKVHLLNDTNFNAPFFYHSIISTTFPVFIFAGAHPC